MMFYDFSPGMIDKAIRTMNAGFYAGEVRFEETRRWRTQRTGAWRIRGVLRTKDSKSPGARKSWSGRGSNSLDWQGHYDFMELLFEQNPDGRITSSLTGDLDYNGITSFYFLCGQNKGRNVGSLAQPVSFGALVGNGR